MISSKGNKQVKSLSSMVRKAKVRRETDLFVIEGIKMFREAPKDRIEEVYLSESFFREELKREGKLLRRADFSEKEEQTLLWSLPLLGGLGKRVSVELLSDEVFQAVSDTQTPQGIMALIRQYHYSMNDLLGNDRGGAAFLLALETIQDPGNLGTIFRSAEGAGVTGIVMNSSTADLYNPKVIRSTMGSVFRMPFIYAEDLPGTVQALKQKGIRFFAAHLEGEHSYDREDYRGPACFLIGNEASGLSDETAALADRQVRIPMAGQVESLNAAVAASVLAFEAARQRRG